MKIVTILLMAVSAILSVKHGWDAFRPASSGQLKMMAVLGINPGLLPYLRYCPSALACCCFSRRHFYQQPPKCHRHLTANFQGC
ncbi:hypothetical protein SNE25_09410 [Mucilaginibacter sabulilitoris]|uniref:Uncharacterized protein n=1 Tax=Mucilaginibacter sabulilitoris TaxID=1173583 RepID=A0ABZ0TVA8_9SPHI|nr:hypothetical protein [Mucilaginibacter sabulilitoris]WPU95734.1 hypothetical protein SNE25_09410 [Mucilaginibacter sabulilitoris]